MDESPDVSSVPSLRNCIMKYDRIKDFTKLTHPYHTAKNVHNSWHNQNTLFSVVPSHSPPSFLFSSPLFESISTRSLATLPFSTSFLPLKTSINTILCYLVPLKGNNTSSHATLFLLFQPLPFLPLSINLLHLPLSTRIT